MSYHLCYNYFMIKNILLLLPARNLFLSHKEWEGACWKKIVKSKKLLDLLITSNERRNIVIRAAVVGFIDSGKGFRQISRELQISRQTISSIKKITKESTYKSYRERSKTERKKKVHNSNFFQKKKESYRYYRRTKYGKIYMPYL